MPCTIDQQHGASVLTIKGRFLGSIERPAWQQTLDEPKAAGQVANPVASAPE